MSRKITATRGPIAVWLAVCAVCVELTISANLLTWAGWPYVTEGGALPLKLHPGSWLIFLSALLLAASIGPWRLIAMDGRVSLFLASMGVCLLLALATTGTGNLIVLLDSFLPAGCLALVLRQATDRQIGALRHAMATLIAFNAVFGLGEMAAGANLIPLYLDDAAYHAHAEDFRPTALYDHPLTGGLMTMLGLALAPARPWVCQVYRLVMWGALVAFGGRMAVGVTALAAVARALVRVGRLVTLRDERVHAGLFIVIATSVASLALVSALLGAGLGDRLAGHLYWDDSAQARLAQWQVLNSLDGWQIALGTARADLLAMITPLRLATGVDVIENFWLLMFVSLGAAGFSVFAAGLFGLLSACWRLAAPRGQILILSVMCVASSSNSLGRKSSVLVCLVAACFCLPVHLSRAPCRQAGGAGPAMASA